MAKNNRPRMPGVTAWAIRKEWLDNIKAGYKKAMSIDFNAMLFDETEKDLQRAGVDVDENGIATINIQGAISRYSDFWSWIFGGATVEDIGRAVDASLASPKVAGLLFLVNSPGGNADGISELSGKIKAASKQKPAVAYVEGDAASAAYWLTSAVPKIVVSKTGWVGSIGAYMSFLDTAKADNEAGVKEIKIISSQSPKKIPDPSTKEGAALYQTQIDDLAQVFIEDVAANRGTTVENVLANYGQGDVFIGSKAVALGMADQVGTLETAKAELGKKIQKAGGIFAMTKEELLAQYPAEAQALMADGASTERERIRGIDGIESSEDKDIIQAAKYDGKSTAADVALKVLNAQKDRRSKMEAARAADGNALAEIAAKTSADTGADEKTEAQERAEMAARIAAKNKREVK